MYMHENVWKLQDHRRVSWGYGSLVCMTFHQFAEFLFVVQEAEVNSMRPYYLLGKKMEEDVNAMEKKAIGKK